jgi:hypothetical protein
MLSIDPSRTDLCDEFKSKPFGRHSADLHKLLDLMRWGFARGRTVILCTVPHKEWRLAKFGPRRGTPMQIDTPGLRRLQGCRLGLFPRALERDDRPRLSGRIVPTIHLPHHA